MLHFGKRRTNESIKIRISSIRFQESFENYQATINKQLMNDERYDLDRYETIKESKIIIEEIIKKKQIN